MSSCNTCSSFGTFIGSINCPSIPLPNLGLPCGCPSNCGCSTSSSCGVSGSDTSCILYSGPQLNCSNILSGDNLTTILGKIDSQICSAIGDFTSFNTQCLAPISTLKQFVEAISLYVCNTQASLTTFTGTTFPAYQTTVTNALAAITNPNLTLCPSSGILMGDSLDTILTKLANSICDIYDSKLSLFGVNWSQCFTVSPTPTTIAQGFSTVIAQICQLNTLIGVGGATLPTFNTVGSCLPTPSASDTLVSTVNKLITRTCQAPTFDINALTWNCIAKPSTTTTDLQDAFQSVLTGIDGISQTLPTQFSGDFVVTPVDSTNLCLGRHIALAVPSAQDRFVAVNNTDSSPGTLVQKLTAGAGISLDTTTTPGTMIINAAASGSSDHKVAVSATDASPDYLPNKVENGVTTSGITITPVLDSGTNKVQFNLTVDLPTLFSALLAILTPGSAIFNQFCNAISACPSPCNAPSNITVTYSSSGTTTTTTTT